MAYKEWWINPKTGYIGDAEHSGSNQKPGRILVIEKEAFEKLRDKMNSLHIDYTKEVLLNSNLRKEIDFLNKKESPNDQRP